MTLPRKQRGTSLESIGDLNRFRTGSPPCFVPNQQRKTMKTYLIIATTFALGMSASAQDKTAITVPEPVKAAFAKQFPKAESAKWEMEDKTDYEAEFKMSGTKYSAKYSAAGKWMETEHKIKADALPDPVKKAIAASYADHKVEGAEMAETPDGVVYEVDLEKGDSEMEVVFNADGKVLKTMMEDGDKKEKGKEDDDQD